MADRERTERGDRAPSDSAHSRHVLRQRQVIGIVIVAAAILVFTLLRADWRGIFPPGWWRW